MSSSYSKKTRRTVSNNPIVVQHTSGAAIGSMSMGGGGTITRQTMRKSFAGPLLPKGQVAARSRDTVNQVIADKQNEKKEMGELNEQFAKLLEAQAIGDAKKALLMEQVEALKREKCPDINSMKDVFVEELEELRKSIAELQAKLAKKESELLQKDDEIESKDNEIDMLKRKIKDLEEKLKTVSEKFCDIERDFRSQQQNMEQMNGTIDMQNDEIQRLKNELAATRSDLQHAREQQIILNGKLDAECNEHDLDNDQLEDVISKLKEEIEILKRCQPNAKAIYEQRFRDSLVKVKESCEDAYRNKQQQLEAMYESRMAELQAAAARKPDQVDSGISREQNRELKSSLNRYKDDVSRLQNELDQWKRRYGELEEEHEIVINKYEDEIARLKNQLEDVNEDLAESEVEIAHLKADVCTLQGEIGTYRNLLDCGTQSLQSTLERTGGIQSRSGEALASIIGGGSGGGSSSQSSSVSNPKANTPVSGASNNQPQKKPADKKPKQPAMSSSSGQVRLKKQSMGTIQITVVSTEGAFVEICNEKGAELDLSGYTMKRENTKGQTVNYEFPAKSKLAGNGKLRLYGKFFEDEMKMDQKSCDKNTKCECLTSVNKWLTGSGTLKLNNTKGQLQANVELTFT